MTRVSLLLLTTTTLLALTSAQQLLPNTLPACAAQCTVLQQAVSSCEANPAAAQSCFCQSSLLYTIKSAPTNNLCPANCDATSWGTIASYYNSQCANGGTSSASSTSSASTVSSVSSAGPPAGQGQTTLQTTATAANGATTPSVVVVTTTTSGGLTANAGITASGVGPDPTQVPSGDGSNYSNGAQWWNGHWRYVIMVIVLFVAFAILGFGGAWCYRRHKRRRDAASLSGTPSFWAPNNSAHDFGDSYHNGRSAPVNNGANGVVQEKPMGKGKIRKITARR